MAANPGTSDADLVEAARAGDRSAMALLMERHRPLVVALCRRVLGSVELAEDAVQEACLAAFLNLDRLRQPASFGPWLGGIGLNACRRLLRQPFEEPFSEVTLSGGRSVPEASRDPGPEEMGCAADTAARVRRAIVELPAGQRSAVVGFYLSGLTHHETADALGISVPAVKTRLHKARASLRRRLQSLEDQMSNGDEAVEMRIADVRRGAHDAKPAAHLVLLQEVGGDRQLPIWIGPQEAISMAGLLEKLELSRPMAPQFLFNALRAVGARIIEVRIDRLAEKTFYAVAVIESPAGTVEVDARPSDALNAALLAEARVTVRPEVLKAADGDSGKTLADLTVAFPEAAPDIVRALISARAEPAAPAESDAGREQV